MVSIIIPSLGRPSINALLNSIRSAANSAELRAEIDYEIIVSLDARAKLVELFPHDGLRVVQANQTGVNRARNEGARQSRGEILWFLDDDTELLGRESFTVIRDLFQTSEVDAAGGDYVSAADAEWSERGYNSFCSIWRTTAGENELEQLLGGTLVVRKSAWNSAEGFDEAIEYGGAETPFVQRLKRNATEAKPARKILFLTELNVRHRPGARGLQAWMRLAYRQGARKNETMAGLPEQRLRVCRAVEFLKRQDVQTLGALAAFSVPYLISSQLGRISRR